jgi:hypothetical protein
MSGLRPKTSRPQVGARSWQICSRKRGGAIHEHAIASPAPRTAGRSARRHGLAGAIAGRTAPGAAVLRMQGSEAAMLLPGTLTRSVRVQCGTTVSSVMRYSQCDDALPETVRVTIDVCLREDLLPPAWAHYRVHGEESLRPQTFATMRYAGHQGATKGPPRTPDKTVRHTANR